MFTFNISDATKESKGNSVPCSQCHVTSSPLHSTVASQCTSCRSNHQSKQPTPPKDVILTVDKQLLNQPSKVMVVCSRQHVEDLNHSNVVQYMWCAAENSFCFIWTPLHSHSWYAKDVHGRLRKQAHGKVWSKIVPSRWLNLTSRKFDLSKIRHIFFISDWTEQQKTWKTHKISKFQFSEFLNVQSYLARVT